MALASAARAETQPSTPVYRVATVGADPTQVWDAFDRRLRELGYVEGGNLMLDRRWSHGYEDRLPTLMNEALRARPDVLITSTLPPAPQVEARQCVPILAIAVWEPYGSCPISPVARMSQASSARDVGAMHWKLARSAFPAAARLAVLTDSDRPFLVAYVRELQAAAAAAGITLHVLDVSGDPDLGRLASAIKQAAPDLLLVGPSFMPPDSRRQILRFARSRRIPSIGSHIADGVVIAADYDWAQLARRTADLVDQILKGADTSAVLSIAAPAKFEIAIDERIARSLGVTIPQSVRAQADRVLN